MAMSRVQAVTFDVGGTLIEPWPSIGQIYAGVAAEHGAAGLNADALGSRFAEAWAEGGGRAETREDWRAVVRATFRDWPALADSEAFFGALYERFRLPTAWRVFDDVVPTLASLKAAGLRLGILSNWDDRLRPLLEQLDLCRWFEVVVISCEAGCRKPDATLFRRAAEAFGFPPEQVLHVGDSWEHDVLGARDAGMQAVQVRRGTAAGGAGALSKLTRLAASRRGD